VPRKYLYTDCGTNSRLDTLQAAVLNVKLPYLADWNRDRFRIAQKYDALLKPLHSKGIVPIENQSGSGHIYHLYVVRVNKSCPVDRQFIQEELAVQGIQSGLHYPVPCHLQEAFRYLNYKVGDFPKQKLFARKFCHYPCIQV
jgi:dTDP-4-amino-4,6-dideoxygalactose transaminase